jgi:Uma2 family endonuclease
MSLIEDTRETLMAELRCAAEDVGFELVGGKLVERQMGWESSEVAARIIAALLWFLKNNKLGRIGGPDAGFYLPNGDVRKPDVSFIRIERLPDQKAPKGFSDIAPDLVVEVISPRDTVDETDEKIGQYLEVGIPLIWVVYPVTKTVQIYRQPSSPQGEMSRLTSSDTITGEEVIPGFSCKVSEFFE